MNKAELAAEVAERLNGTDPDARHYVDAVFDVIMRHVAAGDRVQILGFGTFDTVERAARIGRNPRTGAAIQVPAGVSPRFHAGQTFRAQVTDATPAASAPTTPSAPAAEAEAAPEVQQDIAKPAKAKKGKAEKAKPAKTKPAQSKPVQTKPAQTKPKNAKPADKKAAKPAEKKPAKSSKPAKKSAAKSAKAGKSGKK